MSYNIKKILLISAAVLNAAPVYCGGKVGKIVGGVALGVVTGGASLAITGAVGAAVATGAATAAAVATGGRVPARAGITLNGETGQVRTVDVGVGQRPDGSPLLSQHYESTELQNSRKIQKFNESRTLEPASNQRNVDPVLLHHYGSVGSRNQKKFNWAPPISECPAPTHYQEEYRSFILETPINKASQWTVTTQIYDNRLYDRAYSSTLDLLSRVNNRKEKVSDYTGFSRITKFEPTSFAAAMAMKSFVFEETTLKWNFGIEYLNGQTYHRAWVDGIRDLMIPAYQILYVAAGKYKPIHRKPVFRSSMNFYNPVISTPDPVIMSAASNLDYQLGLTQSFIEKRELEDLTKNNKNISDMLELNKSIFDKGEQGFNMPLWYNEQHSNVSIKERRKSKDITSHVKAIDEDSGWTTVKGVVAQATLFRYKAETLKEEHPELYANFMKCIDGYNKVALASEVAISMGCAVAGNPGPLVGFMAKFALFAGIEMLAVKVSEYGADRLASYCAAGDIAKFASYQKTINFVLEFAIEHGITGAYNQKLAYAGAYGRNKGFNLKKPETTQYRTVTENKNKGGRAVSTRLDADRYLSGLTSQKGVLSEKGITLDNREYYRFNKKCEYMGIKFKKGEYISRDTLHHEWEWFRDPKTHLGPINVLTGEVDTSKADPSRRLRI